MAFEFSTWISRLIVRRTNQSIMCRDSRRLWHHAERGAAQWIRVEQLDSNDGNLPARSSQPLVAGRRNNRLRRNDNQAGASREPPNGIDDSLSLPHSRDTYSYTLSGKLTPSWFRLDADVIAPLDGPRCPCFEKRLDRPILPAVCLRTPLFAASTSLAVEQRPRGRQPASRRRRGRLEISHVIRRHPELSAFRSSRARRSNHPRGSAFLSPAALSAR